MDYGSVDKKIIWKNGMPCPATEKPFSKESINALTRAAFALPYNPKTEIDPDTGERVPLESEMQYLGYTQGEVMVMRACESAANGDLDTFKYLMDRVGGKAVQAVENINVSASLEQYLAAVASRSPLEEQQHVEPLEVIDITAIGFKSPFATLKKDPGVEPVIEFNSNVPSAEDIGKLI